MLFNRRHQKRQSDFRAERRDIDADVGAFIHSYQSVCSDLDILIQHSCFSDALLLKMLVICIFSVTNNARALGKPSRGAQ
jgi:hypothetical protein